MDVRVDYKEGRVPKNWCFQTVVLEKTHESPLDTKELKPSILKEINSEYSLEGLVLKLKLQYFGHLMWTPNSSERSLMLGKIEGRRRKGIRGWDGWKASLIQRIRIGQTLGDGEGQGGLACCSSWGCRVRHDWATKKQQSYFLKFLKSDLLIFSFLTSVFYVTLRKGLSIPISIL